MDITPPQLPATCQTCRHWTRRKGTSKFSSVLSAVVSRPALFGECGSAAVYKATDIEVERYGGGDIYDDCELLLTTSDLSTKLNTRQDFGCVHHEPADPPCPPQEAQLAAAG